MTRRISAVFQEKRFIAWVALVTLGLSSLPYLYGYLSSPPDRVFMGIALGTPDTNQYFAWVRAFTRSLVISNPLTPEPSEAVFFNLLWWLVALGVRLGCSHLVVFHLLRLVAVAVFTFVVYGVCGLFLEDPRWRKTASLIVIFGAGLGWVWVVGKYLTGRLLYPLDVYIVEPNSFLALMAFPHFSLASALILVVFGFVIVGYERRQWRYPLAAGAVSFLLGWSHAYDLLLIYAIVGVFSLVIWMRNGWSPHLLLYPLALFMISCIPAFYSVYITRTFPVWQQVLAQFTLADAWTPDPFHLLLVMGVPLWLAICTYGGLVPLHERSVRELFLSVWFVVNFFIAYVPLSYQIHYLNGWQVPVAILATKGLYQRIIPWLAERWSLVRRFHLPRARWAPTLLFLAVIPTNVYLLAWRFVDLGRHASPYYLHRDEVAALDWLGANTAPDDVVLSALDIGQYIPSISGNRPFLAHWAMTVNFYDKRGRVTAFFSRTTPAAHRRDTLCRFGVRYVLYGLTERQMDEVPIAKLSYLRTVFLAPHAAVYAVDWEAAGCGTVSIWEGASHETDD